MNELSGNIEHLSVSLRSLGYPFAVLLVLIAIGAAIWYYRDSVPPVYGWLKRFLTCMRFLVLFLVIAALTEPVVHTIISSTNRELTAVLIDTSASIDLPVDPTRKRDALEALNRTRSRFGEDALYYSFNSDIQSAEEGEPVFDGHGTDISGAIRTSLERENVSSVLLITDGRWNLGEDPASFDFPSGISVHTILTGTDRRISEFAVENLSSSPVAYEGKKLTLEANVSSALPIDGSIKVSIVGDGTVIASGNAAFGGGTHAKLKIDVIPDKPGRRIYSAVIDPEDDAIGDNNTRSVSVQVLKSSFRILIAASPSSDLAFIRRALEADPAFSVQVITGTEGGSPDIGKPDAAIVIDGGGKALTASQANMLIQSVKDGCGLWAIGSSLGGDGSAAIAEALPVIVPPGNGQFTGDFSIHPTDDGATHFITAGVYTANNRDIWDFLPPLQTILPVASVKPEGNVIAEAKLRSAEHPLVPAIVTGRHGHGKVIAMPVSGIWRWRLMAAGAGKEDAFFSSFVTGTLRWLTSETDTSPLTITVGKGTFLSGQDIEFEGRLFDRIYMPVTGANISIVVDNDQGLKTFLAETEPTVYRGALRGVEAGERRFLASAFVGDTKFAESSGTFTVERSSLETLDTRIAPDVLGVIAARSGGASVTVAGIDSVFSRIGNDMVTHRAERDHILAMNPFFPAAIVFFLVLEWSVRKRKGML